MKRRRTRRYAAPLAVAALALAVGGVWYYRGSQVTAAATEPALQTTRARSGDMLISITGSGTLFPASEVDLGFEEAGRVTEVLVAEGDRVDAGQALARQDKESAQAAVKQAEVNLRLAELELQELNEGASSDELATARANLAQAEENLAQLLAGPGADELASAKAALASAQEAYDELAAGPSSDKVLSAEASLQKARQTLQQAQIEYGDAANDPSKAADAKAAYQNALLDYQVAEANHNAALAGPTSAELQAALAQVATAQSQLEELQQGPTEAEIAAAQAQVESAQAKLDDLLAGATDLEKETASLAVDNARYALEEAQRQLAATELVSPIAGTVTNVDVSVGETVAANAVIISVADLDHVRVRFYVDETDMAKLATGLPVEATFDAFGDQVFTGTVTSIEPGLSNVNMVPVVTAWADLDVPEEGTYNFVENMNATVDVIVAERTGVVLLSMEAVRQIAEGQYAVFVVGANDELEMRPVTVGLSDDVYYEITSGLSAGEVVSTGTATVTGG